MPIKVLFLCPHAAAKSVAAAALLRREAVARDLDLEIDNAGTDPDTEVAPVVRARLESERLSIGGAPRLVSATDLDAADVIINIGCGSRDLPTSRALKEWQIPDFSADPEAAFAALQTRVADLAAELDS